MDKVKRPNPRRCPLCLADGVTKVYKRVTDHVRRKHQLSGNQLRVLLSEARAQSGEIRTQKIIL
ncbi:hypothetical protein DPMN_022723 [Dreissena polymorpha]|uniref:Uncharacterized protein n=1 Tax=Dreissena polymorpha TaxID=45954 RepID=A0A9D4NMY8_DREPO|nr:hypothetical protein DPMN_022723 [Dreissena polymorpha]